jgi:hypothetical protein
MPLALAAPPDGARDFVAVLLSALRAHDVRQVTSLFQYPFRITVTGVPYPVAVATRGEMARLYDTVFNPAMRCAIEQSRVATRDDPHPPYKLAFADGVVTMGDGRVIATRTANGFRITRMSVLAGAKSPAHAPERLPSTGKPPADFQRSGRLDYDDVDAYVVRLRAGDILTAHIERFPGRALVLRVVDAAAGRGLAGGGVNEFARAWSARISRAGDYRVEVARAGAYCDPEVTYVLTVGVR